MPTEWHIFWGNPTDAAISRFRALRADCSSPTDPSILLFAHEPALHIEKSPESPSTDCPTQGVARAPALADEHLRGGRGRCAVRDPADLGGHI